MVISALFQPTLHKASDKLALKNEEKHQQWPYHEQRACHNQAPFGPAFAHLGE